MTNGLFGGCFGHFNMSHLLKTFTHSIFVLLLALRLEFCSECRLHLVTRGREGRAVPITCRQRRDLLLVMLVWRQSWGILFVCLFVRFSGILFLFLFPKLCSGALNKACGDWHDQIITQVMCPCSGRTRDPLIRSRRSDQKGLEKDIQEPRCYDDTCTYNYFFCVGVKLLQMSFLIKQLGIMLERSLVSSTCYLTGYTDINSTCKRDTPN